LAQSRAFSPFLNSNTAVTQSSVAKVNGFPSLVFRSGKITPPPAITWRTGPNHAVSSAIG